MRSQGAGLSARTRCRWRSAHTMRRIRAVFARTALRQPFYGCSRPTTIYSPHPEKTRLIEFPLARPSIFGSRSHVITRADAGAKRRRRGLSIGISSDFVVMFQSYLSPIKWSQNDFTDSTESKSRVHDTFTNDGEALSKSVKSVKSVAFLCYFLNSDCHSKGFGKCSLRVCQ
jgi:hypothetical protein